MSSSTALAVRESTAVAESRGPQLLRPIAAPSAILQAQNEAREMVHQALKEGRDYGVIPGTGDKPTMLKPGAERVALGFGCYYGTPEILEKEIDHDREVRWAKSKRGQATSGISYGLYRYVVQVPVINRETGEIVGSGIGACSSMESKYVERPRDSENTILKMAFKRAIVAACLTTFGLSDEFTQDVEDLAHLNGEASQAATANTGAAEEEKPLTLALALEMPLPGAKTAWNGKGGTPLGQLEPKMLAGVRKWIGNKIAEAEQQNADVPAVHYRLCNACDLIVEMRSGEASKDQTSMDLGATAQAPTSGGPVDMPPAGNVEDAIKPAPANGVAEISRRISALLEHAKVRAATDERGIFLKRLQAADTLEAMQILLSDLEQYIELPF